MPSFNLRPVSDNSPSPSPTASGSPSDRSPAYKGPASPSTPARSRRPLSPSSLRDVDLTQGPDMPPRRYPAPPTGHDLMAMFPPPAPDNFSEMRPGPTSGYFQRQERAFFAQAGKEIVRVRVDVDLQAAPDADAGPKARSAARPWPPPPPHSSAPTNSPGPSLYPGPRPTHTRGPSVPATPVFPPAPHPHPHAHPHAHAHHSPPPEPTASSTASPNGGDFPGDEFRTDDPDEAWRRPMPYNERRRAGKHTRRVVHIRVSVILERALFLGCPLTTHTINSPA
ncbi:hypothetical protein DFH07DRAFT_945968 [Mycena maculata]|uniref:Uncharacterized protein n=1 Tax=Mycena maculata TaxID=230809 RepID=A0AAD7HTH8_9AGAR|nr:hypothetical protein DFH07DRAFT_945968 [Mycena maculata]